jgi:hypothetical protein
MKPVLLFALFFFFTATGFAQQDPTLCVQYKNGVFAYRDESSNAVLVKRTASRQEERIKQSGIVTRFKIRWIDACSYELKQVWSNSKKKRKNNRATTIVQITAISKDEYEFSCACKNKEEAKKNSGTMFRVK